MAQVGTGVTLSGELLAGTTAVTFLGADGPEDDVVAPNFVVLDAKKVLIQVPPGAETGPVEGTASTGARAVHDPQDPDDHLPVGQSGQAT